MTKPSLQAGTGNVIRMLAEYGPDRSRFDLVVGHGRRTVEVDVIGMIGRDVQQVLQQSLQRRPARVKLRQPDRIREHPPAEPFRIPARSTGTSMLVRFQEQ